MNSKTKKITEAALIAALYVVLTYLANALGLASGAIQVRFSEALTILPFFTASAVPGVAIGCLLANILTGCALLDIIFGTLASLIGAVFTYRISKMNFKAKKWMAPLPPILANTIIIPFVLKYAYGVDALGFSFLTVGAGELISAGVLGILLLLALEKQANKIFGTNN